MFLHDLIKAFIKTSCFVCDFINCHTVKYSQYILFVAINSRYYISWIIKNGFVNLFKQFIEKIQSTFCWQNTTS